MDLGTYYVRVEFSDQGFLMVWQTCNRFSHGSGDVYPLTATLIRSNFESEEQIIKSILWQFLEGNYSCDCNRKMFLDRANRRELEEYSCGNDLDLQRLTLIRPDLSESVIFEKQEKTRS